MAHWYLNPDPKPRGRVFFQPIGWIGVATVFDPRLGMRRSVGKPRAFDEYADAYAHAIYLAGRERR